MVFPVNRENLKKRWQKLYNALGLEGNPVNQYNMLVTLYSQKNRKYHNLQHVANCLGEFDLARHLLENLYAVEMAIWFHDALYDTNIENDNEERSARLAREILRELGASCDIRDRVSDLILATMHRENPINIDAAIMMDIDLSGLGKLREEFDENTAKLREESDGVPDEVFRANMIAFFQEILLRPYIYFTEFFRERYEKQARVNLEKFVHGFLDG